MSKPYRIPGTYFAVFCFYSSRGPPVRRWLVRQSNVTALLGEAALFVPGYERNSPLIHSRAQATLTALFRNTAFRGETRLYRIDIEQYSQ